MNEPVMDAQALGRFFRQTREAKELTLQDAERALRIRQRILESFELGEFNLPDSTPVQIRGFIRNYARYLGLDDERMVQYYDAARTGVAIGTTGTKLRGGKYGSLTDKKKKTTQTNMPVAAPSITDTNPSLPPVPAVLGEPRDRTSLFTLLFRLIVAAAALAVIVFVVVQLITTAQEDNVPVAGGDIFDPPPPSPTFTAAPTLTRSSLLPTPLPESLSAFTGSGILVELEVTQRTWLRIETDGVEQYADIAAPGTKIQIPALNQVSVRASNAEALDVIWNGQQQGIYGGRGQLVDVIFTQTDVQVISGPGYEPTSEFSPTPLPTSAIDVGSLIAELTPTITPGPSPTPTETPVPTETPLPTDTPTITLTPSNTPTVTQTPTETLTPSPTFTPSATPTITRTPTVTPIPSETPTPSPTAILPPRVPLASPTPTKDGA